MIVFSVAELRSELASRTEALQAPDDLEAMIVRYDDRDSKTLSEAVKHFETGVVQTFCISASWGWLIHATVGSFGGVGRRANREGFAV